MRYRQQRVNVCVLRIVNECVRLVYHRPLSGRPQGRGTDQRSAACPGSDAACSRRGCSARSCTLGAVERARPVVRATCLHFWADLSDCTSGKAAQVSIDESGGSTCIDPHRTAHVRPPPPKYFLLLDGVTPPPPTNCTSQGRNETPDSPRHLEDGHAESENVRFW